MTTKVLIKLYQNDDYDTFIKIVNLSDDFDINYVFGFICGQGRLDLMKFFIDKYDIDYYYDDNYCFRIACEKNQFEVIKFLIKKYVEKYNYYQLLITVIDYIFKDNVIEFINFIFDEFSIEINNTRYMLELFKRCCMIESLKGLKLLREKISSESFNKFINCIFMRYRNIPISHKMIKYFITEFPKISNRHLMMAYGKDDDDPIYEINNFIQDAVNKNLHKYVIFYLDNYPGAFLPPYKLPDGSNSWKECKFSNNTLLYKYVHNICDNGNYDILKWIIEKFPNIDIHNDNEKIFKICCIYGNFDTLYYLKLTFLEINHNNDADWYNQVIDPEILNWLQTGCPIHRKLPKSAMK